MLMIEACRIEYARKFGTCIHRSRSALAEAVSWLQLTLDGQRHHHNLKVQSCKAPFLPPIGIKRIDDMLRQTGFSDGFGSGNVSSNMQTSVMLPAFATCRVNGFTVIDGKPCHRRALLPGDLQARALKPMLESRWNDQLDRQALRGVQDALKDVPPDRGTTLYRIMHMRTKETRYLQPSPVHTHGWLLIDDHDELRYERRIGSSAAGAKLFELAKLVLTNTHADVQTLLEIKDARITFVDPEVMTALQGMENMPSAETIKNYVISKTAWERDKDAMALEPTHQDKPVPM